MANVLTARDPFSAGSLGNKPLVLILMGPPGAGKGTHAGPLSDELNLPHISTGDLFREHIRNRTPLGIQAKTFMDQGNLVPDKLVLDMLFERVGQTDCKNGYILDGFPRTVPQAEAFTMRLKGRVRTLALYFNLPDSSVIERITGRIGCTACGRPHHKTFAPPKKAMICDGCGGPLLQREDDRESVILKRLEVYRAQTAPLIAYYAKQLTEINAANAKPQVFQEILDALFCKVSRG